MTAWTDTGADPDTVTGTPKQPRDRPSQGLSFEHHVHGAGLVVLALGCVAVSAALLEMSNDEFDLPPSSRR